MASGYTTAPSLFLGHTDSMFIQTNEQGRILATVNTSQKFADVYPEYTWVDVGEVSWFDHYVAGSQVLLRPEPESIAQLSAPTLPADGNSVVTLSDIPLGALVQISGPVEDEWIEESGSAEISVDIPGRYIVKVEKWPQKSVEVTFDAT